ncbi:type II toxin-antitoxin system VapB family antitoxin [Rhizobacter sp. Root16D2]|uniref:type II toxin-antitoxin system VapB family antitoxin n=2 Tax=Rhizobacter TaxID=212743 RepID=UPI001F1B96F5|nr:type II toxin-antitoxin system VapB family antitoxin [Rhizobacter sp. Root16D2]
MRGLSGSVPPVTACIQKCLAEPICAPSIECVRIDSEIHIIMRTNIVIDDKLMRDALRVSGAKTKREVVELALQTLLQLNRQAQARQFRGKLQWEGDLDTMRTDK